MDELEAKFEGLEKSLADINAHQLSLDISYNQLIEIRHVLEFAEKARNQPLSGANDGLIIPETGGSLLAEEGRLSVRFASVSGLVPRAAFEAFEKICFRATRGNLYMKSAEIPTPIREPSTGAMIEKNVFVIFFQGQRLETKIRKICEAHGVNLYPCPDTSSERLSLLDQANAKLDEIQLVLERGLEQRYQLLSGIGTALNAWFEHVQREKSIYHTLNMFNYDLGRRCLIAEGWCPVKCTEDVQMALRTGRERSGALIPSILNIVPTTETPPTYFRTNKITSGFQDIVDSYGTARYREVNPAVFTIVTFPFEFGIMFGDVGHGVLLLIVASLLIKMESQWEGKKLNEMIAMPFKGRYTIFLMSLFAIYIGALYNELFAVPMNFGSNWLYVNEAPYNTFRPASNWTYPFGVDPVWKGATNELTFYNSLKMKTSIVIGVIQMTLGLFMHLFNAVYFKLPYDIWFEFVPRILFLMSTFGYLVFMIFFKWNYNWAGEGKAHDAPVLLNELIFMFLPSPNPPEPFYAGKQTVESILVYIAMICVPMMMFPKPVLLHFDQKAKEHGYSNTLNWILKRKEQIEVVAYADEQQEELQALEDADGLHIGGAHHEEHEEHDFGEMMVHQGLETIEFVLGCISHTASYLRLWALSLAHSELSTVFWEKIFGTFWEMGHGKGVFVSGLGTFIGWSIWFMATVLVILAMESLSAFLHALRLHWVEFQSKFYRGDGHPFVPFSYVRKEEEA
eukprot:TRINITY_DN230_c1_g1_i1.p1 TRINITY_DN230_c1_g1~~TRINITY_DN230_c1_g1_i1.p1  ORF type:complete len:853 (+),score=177.88 TRINITY_DN230_c1_g1_i1:349-2559(+)